MAARDWDKLARDVIEHVGGTENISGMTHCATRLRLNLKDESIVDDEEVRAIDGVVNVAHGGGQYQILIGIEVPKLYESFEGQLKGSGGDTRDERSVNANQDLVSKVFGTISGIFAPLLAPLAGSGILRGLIILFTKLGVLQEGSSTYTILYAAGSAVFYLLPVLLLISTAKRFRADPYIAALIGGALIYPDFVALLNGGDNGSVIADFLGIPVVLMSYSSTVVPAILAGLVYSALYRLLDDHVHENLKLVVPPLISLVVMVPLTMIVVGPLAVYGGEAIASVVNWAIGASGLVAGILVGGGWSVLVSFGIHWAVNPIMINNIASVGRDLICPLTFACNFAVIGVASAFFSRRKMLRSRRSP